MKLTPAEIAAIRQALGLNQSQLARLMGIRAASVNDWEADRQSPNSTSIRLLLAYSEGYRPKDWPKGK